ncbi:MAG: CCA tRNA nucleotidyltransferase [Candidatus Aenigmatarchaeota archaeon]
MNIESKKETNEDKDDENILRMKIKKIETEVLKKIKPKKEEVDEMHKFINELLRVSKVVAPMVEPVIVGSAGRDTWISGKHDIDLFLVFPDKISKEELKEKGLEYGKKIAEQFGGKYMIKYAEHPYVRAEIMNKFVDIVPCYKIKKNSKIISAVDRSPLHTIYLLKNLDSSLKDDVRLLKQFCKGIGIYGSDLKTQGISGYACELLILKYGRFYNAISAIARFRPGYIIDIEGYWSNVKKVKEKFKKEPLIIIDPVDKNRNVTSALSCENFIRLVAKAKEFLENPRIDFFFPKEESLTRDEILKIKSRETKFIAIVFNKPDVIDDILYPQLRKGLERLSILLEKHEFRIIRRYCFAEESKEKSKHKAYFIFELEEWNPPRVEKRIGPSIFIWKNALDFIEKYKNESFSIYVNDDFLIVEKERKYRNVKGLIEDFLSVDENKLRERGIPSHIAKEIANNFKILEHKDFWKELRENKELSTFIKKKYFEKIIM